MKRKLTDKQAVQAALFCYKERLILKLGDIYQLAIKLGMENDPRDKEMVERTLKTAQDYSARNIRNITLLPSGSAVPVPVLA